MQQRWFILTIPAADWSRPEDLPTGVQFLRGQRELALSGFEHWQLVVAFCSRKRLAGVKAVFTASTHVEACVDIESSVRYVWKDETSVADTRFELGVRAMVRSAPKDWDAIWDLAKAGNIESIPKDIVIRCYNSLQRIRVDYLQPPAQERTACVYWGASGTGKSRTAWDEAGLSAYAKDPNTKFWCGYRGQEHVVVDEFRGNISISHILRWLDRYPVIVEVKGSAVVLNAVKFWFTSNIPLEEWYPGLDDETVCALRRRVVVTKFH